MMHRDDVPFELISQMEENLGSKITFPGDLGEISPETARLIESRRQATLDSIALQQCRMCKRKINDFNPENLVGLDLSSIWEKDYQWDSKECRLSWNLMSDLPSLTCNECLGS